MNIFLLTITCTKSTMEMPVHGVKYAQSQQKSHRSNIFDVNIFLYPNIYTKNVKKPKCSNNHQTQYSLKYSGKDQMDKIKKKKWFNK